jgi:signal transduction histidine kinase
LAVRRSPRSRRRKEAEFRSNSMGFVRLVTSAAIFSTVWQMKRFVQRSIDTPGASRSQEAPARSAKIQERVKLRILIPLIAAIGILLTAFGLGIHEQQQQASARSIRRAADEVQQLLGNDQKQYIEVMTTTLQAVLSDDRLAEAFRERNRQALLERTKPLYDNLSRTHSITHFYFHTPDRVNLLRMHSPERNGDKINRYTALEAERTGKISSGIERGPIGTFVLRVITPWRRDGQLLGYVELGVEFEDVIKRIHGLLDVDFVVAVDKRFLNREQWNKGLKTYNKEDCWGQFPFEVVMDKTVAPIPDPVQQYLRRAQQAQTRKDGVASWNGRVSQMVFLPLHDASGKTLGQLIVLRDITAATAQMRYSVLAIALICPTVSVVLVGFFYIFLGRIERKLEEGTAKLRTEIIVRQTAEQALQQAHDRLEERVEQRTRELKLANEELHSEMARREETQGALDAMHKQLLEASRRAGMAEVATGVLHNVGNVLTSVNVSSTIVANTLHKSKAANLAKVVALLREHESDLGTFMTADPKGKQLPGYLAQLAEHLAGEQAGALKELVQLQKNIEHIRDIVTMQQSYAKVSGVTETVNVSDLVEDALRMNASALARHDVQTIRELAGVPPITVEKHKVLQILVNLIHNAKYACDESGRSDKRLTVRVTEAEGRVRISVRDNGVGIPPENLTRIFSHGFTTRKDGHGFGLHSGALAAREMGGTLSVHSEGLGHGATFTVELPLQPAAKLAA